MASPAAHAGSCLCGDIAWQARSVIAMWHFHCSRCRKSRSAAWASNLLANGAGFRWLRGEIEQQENTTLRAAVFAARAAYHGSSEV